MYALVDLDGDGDATGPDEAKPITAKMKCPNGIAYLDGNLYVAQMDAVKKIQNVDDWLKNPKSLYPVITNLIDSADDSLEGVPNTGWHGWRYMTANNATKKLYLAVGSPCVQEAAVAPPAEERGAGGGKRVDLHQPSREAPCCRRHCREV